MSTCAGKPTLVPRVHEGHAVVTSVPSQLCVALRRVFVAAAFLLGVALLLVNTSMPAFADEEASQEDIDAGNAVNVQQRPDSSFIYDTSIEDLAAADAYYDGQTVQVTGEVVGDDIRESLLGDYRWITLEADAHDAYISIYMSEAQTSKIDAYGAYGVQGTTLQVRGTYHLACPEHEGLSDLHAEEVSVVETGQVSTDSFDIMRFIPGIILLALGLVLTGVYYFLRERQR